MHCTEMNTDVDEVEYITVGVGELRITNTSDGNGNDERLVRCERPSHPHLGQMSQIFYVFFTASQIQIIYCLLAEDDK